MRRWQVRWEAGPNGRWTWRLIKNIRSWTNKKYGEVNYYVCQALTGHGNFRTYLKRIGKTEEDPYPGCGVPVARRCLKEFQAINLNAINESCGLLSENDVNCEAVILSVRKIIRLCEERKLFDNAFNSDETGHLVRSLYSDG
ncbi:hypothetical protein NQ315_016500 [Exocentrus adspersus]|uniref:Uncharacterized protein n=1 Tax=Exocentrus adspersus TaxID=1586481 RepID=A0AAV8VZE6_9CUCU|nr:hypothetical protein NQ315_016500 [Exocentrus adspersus]